MKDEREEDEAEYIGEGDAGRQMNDDEEDEGD